MFPPFFAVSVRKLLVMHVVTGGTYQLYWFYCHWKAIRDFHRTSISPAARTVMAPIFAFALFQRACAAASGLRPWDARTAALLLGLLFLALDIGSYLPESFALLMALTTLTVLPLLPVQIWANRAIRETAPGFPMNTRLTRWNWIGVALAGMLLTFTDGAALFSDTPLH